MDYSEKQIPGVRVTNTIIGHGSSSIVFLGIRKKDSTQVAVKFIRSDRYTDDDFKNEIEILTRLGGKYVPKYVSHAYPDEVYSGQYHKTNRDYVIAMEYIKGSSLEELRTQRLSEEAVKFVVTSFVRAVDFLHENGLYHRDIKLQNAVLCERTMRVRLIDFGVGCLYKDHTCSHIYGSIRHYSPELGTEMLADVVANEVWGKADAWALGLSIYEFVTGTIPYENVSAFAMINGMFIHKENVPHLVSNISQVDTIVNGLLLVDPSQRMTVREALNVLDDDYICKRSGHQVREKELREMLVSKGLLENIDSYEACRELNDIDTYTRNF